MGGRSLTSRKELRSRCEVQDDGCWLWLGGTSRGRPTTKINSKTRTGPTLVAAALGRLDDRPAEKRWFMACGKALCVSPDCLRMGTLRDMRRSHAKRGAYDKDIEHRRRLSEAMAKVPTTHPDWVVQWAIESPQNQREVEHALGVPQATISTWRRRAKRAFTAANCAGPFSQLLKLAA